MKIVMLTILFFGIAMAIMAVGLVITGKCLRGSCGGPEVRDEKTGQVSCGICGRNKEEQES